MPKYILLLTYLIGVLSVSAQIDTQPFDPIRAEFEQYAGSTRAEFEAYEAKARADYQAFVNSIKNIWGGDSIINDTRIEWVEYDSDFRSRSIVNFEKGDILIEVIIDDNNNSSSTINNRLAGTIERLLSSRGESLPYKAAGQSTPLTKEPILDNIVDFSKYDLSASDTTADKAMANRPVPLKPTVKGRHLAENSTSDKSENGDTGVNVDKAKTKSTLAEKRENARLKAAERASALSGKYNKTTIAQKIAQQSKKKVSSITGNDGKPRQVVQIQMNLVADNLSKNAYKYKDIVAEFSEKFQVEQPLIFAVMEVESAFNPKAKSWADAHGLMQLVPKYGGATAYQYVYKKSWIPEPGYLYNPRNNIELGTAYLRILMNTFSKVIDTHCQRLCVIAGYNTGPGNVSRAFNKTRNLNSQVFALINGYEYTQLYNHLITNLPAQETRNYVKKVTEKREKYLKK